MAARLFTKKSRVIAYLPNIQAAVKYIRAFSSHDEYRTSGYTTDDEHSSLDAPTIWPVTNLGPFSPRDKRFPLPGLVGSTKEPKKTSDPSVPLLPRVEPIQPEDLFEQLAEERQKTIMNQVEESVKAEEAEFTPKPTPADLLECTAHKCPLLLRQDFQDLFPNRNLSKGTLTVITICHKTENDMSSWSMDVETERETLLETFIQGATEICEALNTAGHWADFIEPSCGKPYFGPHTNAAMFETDERYRKLGFEISDLGCCKVISHHIWGTHSYVGCVFTNAPLDDPVVKNISD